MMNEFNNIYGGQPIDPSYEPSTKLKGNKNLREGKTYPGLEELSQITLKVLKKPSPISSKKTTFTAKRKYKDLTVIQKICTAVASLFSFKQDAKILSVAQEDINLLPNPLRDGDSDTASLSYSSLGSERIELSFRNLDEPTAIGDRKLSSRAEAHTRADEAIASYDEWKDDDTKALVQVGRMIAYARRCHWNSDREGQNLQNARKYYAASLGLIERMDNEGIKAGLRSTYVYYYISFADMCATGEGEEEDLELARNYFDVGMPIYLEREKVAFEEAIPLFVRYAEMCYNGEGGKIDYNSARRYFKIAADRGDIDAFKNFVLMLYDGDGLEEGTIRSPQQACKDRLEASELLQPYDLEVRENKKGEKVYLDDLGNEVIDHSEDVKNRSGRL